MTNETKEDIVTRKAKRDMFMEYVPYLIIIAFIIIIRTFIATPVKVNGSSMSPTLYNGDTMILYKLTKNDSFRGLKRFDIVVVKTDSGKLIKRIIALPGEKIKYVIKEDEYGVKKGILYINGKEVKESFIKEAQTSHTCDNNPDICQGEITVPKDEYYVMGDNRGNSKDSRIIGTVSKNKIMGTTKLIIFPFTRFGYVE